MITQAPALIEEFIAKTEDEYKQAGLGPSATSLPAKSDKRATARALPYNVGESFPRSARRTILIGG